jgi:small subunit ribosomal protein S16
MVKIRLTRAGARNRPFYRIVAVDERRPRDGRPLEFLGTFDPKVNPEKLSVRSDAVEAWVKKGAQLSPTVKSLLRRAKRHSARAASA